MNISEQYTVMVARCESTARQTGHTLDVWYPVSEQLRASLCKICGAMVWVTRGCYELPPLKAVACRHGIP
jgi:hypothetical protein